jgi:hypothetical protein
VCKKVCGPENLPWVETWSVAAENSNRATIQMPQGLDAPHGGERFPEGR